MRGGPSLGQKVRDASVLLPSRWSVRLSEGAGDGRNGASGGMVSLAVRLNRGNASDFMLGASQPPGQTPERQSLRGYSYCQSAERYQEDLSKVLEGGRKEKEM